ncbi:MAG: phosphoribosylamine--glycine ligase [Phycisphaerales bacterium]|nr:phosphoribosylamine--glycine ligase [Phycisphaerales bacterium]
MTTSPLPEKLNVLLVGTGGREHALAWRLSQSPHLGKLWVEPSANAGLLQFATACPEEFSLNRKYYLERWLIKEQIGFIIIGPEGPLAEGMVDALALPTRPIFGPTKAAARLEWDKAYAKSIMRQTSIPTAEGRVCTTLSAALTYVTERDEPCVVKATGLCAGKGVTVCRNATEAIAAVQKCMGTRAFGEAGDSVVIEERLEGQEVSILALVDGRTITLLDTCQDYKQVGEGDTGPNTGGMGAFCPTPLLSDSDMQAIARDVFVPAVDGLRRQGVEFRGVLFAGIMLTPAGPKVLEFNCRFGDPETQVLMARFRGDLLKTLWLTATGNLADADFGFDQRPACCVVVCSEGYPGPHPKGRTIQGLQMIDSASDSKAGDHWMFHGATKRDAAGKVATSGGRVVTATCLGSDLEDASGRATALAASVTFRGSFFRRDIGHRVLKSHKSMS